MKRCKLKGCSLNSSKVFKGYCTLVHQRLDQPPKFITLECANCSGPVIRTPSRISKGGKAYCSRCSKNSGDSHPNWKEGQYINTAGYRLVLVKDEYVLEHRTTWEQANRSCILKGMHGMIAVHHINMTKADNRPLNLVLLSSRHHGQIHRFIDHKKYDQAKKLLISALETQTFFLENSEHLDYYKSTPLEVVLNLESKHD